MAGMRTAAFLSTIILNKKTPIGINSSIAGHFGRLNPPTEKMKNVLNLTS